MLRGEIEPVEPKGGVEEVAAGEIGWLSSKGGGEGRNRAGRAQGGCRGGGGERKRAVVVQGRWWWVKSGGGRSRKVLRGEIEQVKAKGGVEGRNRVSKGQGKC